MFSRMLLCSIALSSAISTSSSPAHADEPPIRLTIEAPKRTGNTGVLLNEDWALTFRAEISDAVTYIKHNGGGSVFPGAGGERFGLKEFIVVRDPDNCLDLRDQTLDGTPYTLECPADPADEEVLPVYAGAAGTCSPEPRSDGSLDPEFSLSRIDGAYQSNVSGSLLPLPPASGPNMTTIGPPTGGADDCYGYGRDDALPGLVVIADIGASRFYTETFDRDPAHPGLKNMAGLLSYVAVELTDRRGITSVVGTIRALQGMFDHIVAFDASATGYPGFDYLRRIDGGPVEALTFSSTPPSPLSGRFIQNAMVDAIPISRVLVSAVLVKEPAPDVIEDWNSDGKIRADDLTAAGLTLLSNEAHIWIRSAPLARLSDDAKDDHGPGCVLPAPLYMDLDDDESAGPACLLNFDGSSGSSAEIPL